MPIGVRLPRWAYAPTAIDLRRRNHPLGAPPRHRPDCDRGRRVTLLHRRVSMLHRRRPTRFEPPPPKSEPGRRTAGEGRATETEGSVYHILYSLQTGSGISLDNMPDPLYSRLVSGDELRDHLARDRKSTRLNSSHHGISYAVFCLKK